MRSLGATLLAGAWLLGAGSAVAETPTTEAPAALMPQAAPATPGSAPVEAKVDGFRSATFGMTDVLVRQAIKKDFPAIEKVSSETNPTEKTTVLSLVVPDLIPGTPKAKVSYILGFTSKKLTQVNVTWVAEPKSQASAEALVGAANLLRNYFATANYRPESIVANQQAPNGYIVFRGIEARGRMVMVVLTGSTGAPDQEKAPPMALQLSYVLDPEHPDVYQVPKGLF